MKSLIAWSLALAALLAANVHAAAAAPAACPALLQHTFPRLQDEVPQPLGASMPAKCCWW